LGKVCDFYELDDGVGYLFVVVSDCILVYDYVLVSIIFDKGWVFI